MLEPDNSDRSLKRRGFLNLALISSLTALMGQAAAGLFNFFKPKENPDGFGGLIRAGRTAEFPPGSMSHVRAGNFFVSHVEGDGLLAIWHRCTHLGCTVPWSEDEDRFHCPCHSSLFNEKGEVTGGPAPRPLDLFPIEIRDGEVLVDTGSPIERDDYQPDQAVPS